MFVHTLAPPIRMYAIEPTCPAGKIYKACGQLVPPSCDAPDGVDGCAEGCFCPDGQFLTRNGECVAICPGLSPTP